MSLYFLTLKIGRCRVSPLLSGWEVFNRGGAPTVLSTVYDIEKVQYPLPSWFEFWLSLLWQIRTSPSYGLGSYNSTLFPPVAFIPSAHIFWAHCSTNYIQGNITVRSLHCIICKSPRLGEVMAPTLPGSEKKNLERTTGGNQASGFWNVLVLTYTFSFSPWTCPTPPTASRSCPPGKMDGPLQEEVHRYDPHISRDTCLTGNWCQGLHTSAAVIGKN